jgi:uncharacterized membrane protein
MNEAANDPLPKWQAPQVNRVTLGHPWQWLAKGWQDIRAAPGYSLRYGAGIVLISGLILLLTVVGQLTFLVHFLTAGFFLIAPLLAGGLYQMSAHLERGEPLASCQALEAIKRNQGQLGVATGFLFIILQLWILASVFCSSCCSMPLCQPGRISSRWWCCRARTSRWWLPLSWSVHSSPPAPSASAPSPSPC